MINHEAVDAALATLPADARKHIEWGDMRRALNAALPHISSHGEKKGAAISDAHVEKMPPESSVVLAAKYRFEVKEGKVWNDASEEDRQSCLGSVRAQLSHGPLLAKAKYLARVGATSWTDYFPASRDRR